MNKTKFFWQQVKNRFTILLITVSRDNALGFVEKKKAFNRIQQWLIVKCDDVFLKVYPHIGITSYHFIHMHATGKNPSLSNAPGSQSKFGEQAIQRNGFVDWF